MQDIKAQLTEEIAQIDWNSLIPHAQRDSLILVNENLNLLDVGVAIASDDVVSVQHWISEQLIRKPSPDELSTWNIDTNKQFSTLIVQPFVLVQEKAIA
ncbi:MAG: DUF2288 domain-containing protein [Moorea sp. SIO2B7]|nr:DUF2288 domain-containing protein [Moorena sp. SIO2B7]